MSPGGRCLSNQGLSHPSKQVFKPRIATNGDLFGQERQPALPDDFSEFVLTRAPPKQFQFFFTMPVPHQPNAASLATTAEDDNVDRVLT